VGQSDQPDWKNTPKELVGSWECGNGTRTAGDRSFVFPAVCKMRCNWQDREQKQR